MGNPTPATSSQKVMAETRLVLSNGESKKLPAGAIVKYVKFCYVPKHALDTFGEYNEDFRVAVYTQFGLGLIDRDALDWYV